MQHNIFDLLHFINGNSYVQYVKIALVLEVLMENLTCVLRNIYNTAGIINISPNMTMIFYECITDCVIS